MVRYVKPRNLDCLRIKGVVMNDRSWMLNPSAITAARNCIHFVQDELGVKLKLSHPQFIEMLQEYAELTDSEELNESLATLLQYADGDVPTLNSQKDKAVARRDARPAKAASQAQAQMAHNATGQGELVEHRGKFYPMYNAQGLKFQGLYRGQARYS
jgi:hypothetical protein